MSSHSTPNGTLPNDPHTAVTRNRAPDASHEGSMDQTYDQPQAHSKKKFWVLMLGVLVTCFVVFWIMKGQDEKTAEKNKKPVARPIPVETETAYKDDIGVYLNALGTVVPRNTVNIVSRIQGQIVKINFVEGQMVKTGELLIEIDPRPYQAALDQSSGQLMRDQATLKQAQIDLTRYQKAYKQNAIAKQQLDDQVQLVKQDEGTVMADHGAFDNAKTNLDYCFIRSPINGRLGLRLVDIGNMVQANGTSALAVVAEIQPVDVVFNIPEDRIGDVQIHLRNLHTAGTAQALEVDAYDRTQSERLANGRLIAVDNVVDPTTGTVKLKAEYDNKDLKLFPNQFVNARLKLETESNRILVSSAAVQRNSKGAFVYVIKPDQTAELRDIKVGVSDGPITAVDGVNADEVVAVNGFDKLASGAKVAVHNEHKAGDTQQAQQTSDASNPGNEAKDNSPAPENGDAKNSAKGPAP